MTDAADKPPARTPPPPTREQALAQALRANLKRRKAPPARRED